jgi:hypothetical protein
MRIYASDTALVAHHNATGQLLIERHNFKWAIETEAPIESCLQPALLAALADAGLCAVKSVLDWRKTVH